MSDKDLGQATLLMDRLRDGDADAGRELLPLLYDELRAIAGRMFRGQRADHTLQPTVLVHEAFLKLLGKPASDLSDRAHFFALAAAAMRQILVNHARTKNADKRGGGAEKVMLMSHGAVTPSENIDVLALNEVLGELEKIDQRKFRIVELRFFGGLTVPEIAKAMNVSVTTVESDWRAARAWLAAKLK